MRVNWTKHAEERAAERSGHPLRRLARRIEQAVRTGKVYRPSNEIIERSSGEESEMWVVVDGPKGKATAVVVDRDDELLVITVRESESCQQGEKAQRKGTGYYPFKDLLGGLVL